MENGISSYCRFLNGDDDGMVELIRDYKDGLILYIDSIVHNISLSEELTEDTFVKIAVKKPRYKDKYSFKAWLYAIGRNVTKDYLRKHSHDASQYIDEDIEDKEDLEQEHIRNEEKIMLHRTMRKLKSEYQQVLSLVYFEQLSNTEAAAVMHRSKRQIENLLYYAKKALRSELEEGGFQYEEL